MANRPSKTDEELIIFQGLCYLIVGLEHRTECGVFVAWDGLS